MMSTSRIAWIGALGSVIGWGAKAVAIGIAGGLGKSPAEGPLFAVGLLSALVGAGALGAALAHARPTWQRRLAAVGGVVVLMLIAAVCAALAAALQPDDAGWVWGEVNLWVGALVLLGAVWTADAADRLGSRRGASVSRSFGR